MWMQRGGLWLPAGWVGVAEAYTNGGDMPRRRRMRRRGGEAPFVYGVSLQTLVGQESTTHIGSLLAYVLRVAAAGYMMACDHQRFCPGLADKRTTLSLASG